MKQRMQARPYHLGKRELVSSDAARFNWAQVVSEELTDRPCRLFDAAPPKVVFAFDEPHRDAIGVSCREDAQAVDRDE